MFSSEEVQLQYCLDSQETTFAWLLCTMTPTGLRMWQVKQMSLIDSVHSYTLTVSIKDTIWSQESSDDGLLWSDKPITEGHTAVLSWS